LSEPRSIRWYARFAFLALLAASPLQAATGTLQGRVLDPQGRAVSGAHVAVEKEGAALRREATTDAAGSFTLPELPAGSYSLVTEAQGFAPRTHKGLTVEVGQSYRLDVTLEVGAVTESVEAVAEGLLLVKAGSSTVDTVIGSTAIEQLPLNGRNFLELAFLVPGNVPTPNFDPTKTNSVLIASAGGFIPGKRVEQRCRPHTGRALVVAEAGNVQAWHHTGPLGWGDRTQVLQLPVRSSTQERKGTRTEALRTSTDQVAHA
jgi:hypothetical protein